jgi:hypothetical protein
MRISIIASAQGKSNWACTFEGDEGILYETGLDGIDLGLMGLFGW